MKKIVTLLVFILFILSSCGPHRMGCGARGICSSQEKMEIVKPDISKPNEVKG